MSTSNDSTGSHSETAGAHGGRLLQFVSEHRVAAYGVALVGSIWFLGYGLDLAAGGYSESTDLVHTISGLLGATAMVAALCAVFVGLLWAGLFVRNRQF